jgi:hypothetical protein
MRFTAAFFALILTAGPAMAQGSQNVPTAPAHHLQGHPKSYGGAAYSGTPALSPAEEVRQDVLHSSENLAILRGGTAAQGAMPGYQR